MRTPCAFWLPRARTGRIPSALQTAWTHFGRTPARMGALGAHSSPSALLAHFGLHVFIASASSSHDCIRGALRARCARGYPLGALRLARAHSKRSPSVPLTLPSLSFLHLQESVLCERKQIKNLYGEWNKSCTTCNWNVFRFAWKSILPQAPSS